MIQCKESFFDIVAVWPLAAGSISYTVPFNVRSRTITPTELGATDMETFLKDKKHYSVGENYDESDVVEIEERKCSVKSTTKYTSAGRAFDVSLVLIISEKSTLSVQMMDEIEASAHDFIFQCVDGELLLVRSADNAYKCVAEEEVAEVYQQKLTLTLENYNGIQRITETT